MNGRRFAIAAVAVATVILTIDAVAPPDAAARPRSRRWSSPQDLEIVLEGGAALPFGDLGDDYLDTPLGFGAESGYDVGVRFRVTWPSGWALAPSIHYQDFGDFAYGDGDALYEIKTSIVRYGLDAQYLFESRRGGPQPFLSMGLALCHNRYRDEDVSASDASWYEAASDALAFGFGGGIKIDTFELSATYTVNRFESARLIEFGMPTDYNWDTFVVRAGFALPAN